MDLVQRKAIKEYALKNPGKKMAEIARDLSLKYMQVWHALHPKSSRKKKEKEAVKLMPMDMSKFIPVDIVNHPPHYKDGGIETIDYIEAKGLSYNLGNVVKYVSRAGKKNPDPLTVKDSKLQDLKKALWYLSREIETVEKSKP